MSRSSSSREILSDFHLAVRQGNAVQLRALSERVRALSPRLSGAVSLHPPLSLPLDEPSLALEDWTPLLYAAKCGDAAVLHALIDLGADPTVRGGRRATDALELAAVSGDRECVEILVRDRLPGSWTRAQLGGDLREEEGRSPLVEAARGNHGAVVGVLLTHARFDAKHAPPSRRRGRHATSSVSDVEAEASAALCAAAAAGHETTVRVLLDARVRVPHGAAAAAYRNGWDDVGILLLSKDPTVPAWQRAEEQKRVLRALLNAATASSPCATASSAARGTADFLGILHALRRWPVIEGILSAAPELQALTRPRTAHQTFQLLDARNRGCLDLSDLVHFCHGSGVWARPALRGAFEALDRQRHNSFRLHDAVALARTDRRGAACLRGNPPLARLLRPRSCATTVAEMLEGTACDGKRDPTRVSFRDLVAWYTHEERTVADETADELEYPDVDNAIEAADSGVHTERSDGRSGESMIGERGEGDAERREPAAIEEEEEPVVLGVHMEVLGARDLSLPTAAGGQGVGSAAPRRKRRNPLCCVSWGGAPLFESGIDQGTCCPEWDTRPVFLQLSAHQRPASITTQSVPVPACTSAPTWTADGCDLVITVYDQPPAPPRGTDSCSSVASAAQTRTAIADDDSDSGGGNLVPRPLPSRFFLGQATISADMLRTSPGGTRNFPLRRRPGFGSQDAVQGYVTLRLRHVVPPTAPSAESLAAEDLAAARVAAWAASPAIPAIALTIFGANGLPPARRFGKNDPFARVLWNGHELGQTNAALATMEPRWVGIERPAEEESIAGVPSVKGAINARFLLPIPEREIGLDSCDLVVEICNWDRYGLGSVCVLGSFRCRGAAALRRLFASQHSPADAAPVETCMRPYSGRHFGLCSGPAPRYGGPVIPGAEVLLRVDPIPRSALPPQLPVAGLSLLGEDVNPLPGLTIRLHGADDLAKKRPGKDATATGRVDRTGKRDTFCVVRWDGFEVCRTGVCRKSLRPRWPSVEGHAKASKEGGRRPGPLPTFALPMPATGSGLGNAMLEFSVCEWDRYRTSGSDREVAIARLTGQELLGIMERAGLRTRSGATTVLQTHTHQGAPDETHEWSEHFHLLSPHPGPGTDGCAQGSDITDREHSGWLHVEFCTSWRVLDVQGDGSVAVVASKEQGPPLERSPTARREPHLVPSPRMGNQTDQTAAPVMDIAPEDAGEGPSSGISIAVRIISCRNLPAADGPFGKSDPFARVTWDGNEIGTTPVIKSNLNPSWPEDSEDCEFVIEAMRGGATADLIGSNMMVEVLDWDRVGSHDLLGSITLSDADLCECSTKGRMQLPLARPGKRKRRSAQATALGPELTLKVTMDEMSRRALSRAFVDIHAQ